MILTSGIISTLQCQNYRYNFGLNYVINNKQISPPHTPSYRQEYLTHTIYIYLRREMSVIQVPAVVTYLGISHAPGITLIVAVTSKINRKTKHVW